MWFWFNTNTNEFEKQETLKKSLDKSDCKQDCKEYEILEENTPDEEKTSEDNTILVLMKLKNIEARMLELEYKVDDIITLLHEMQQRAESPDCDCYKDCFNFYDPIPSLEKETQTELDKFLEETLQINMGPELIIDKKHKTEIANTLKKNKKDKNTEKPLILKCFDKLEENKFCLSSKLVS